jgi:glycerophosphoryl diester phosphodiesterase
MLIFAHRGIRRRSIADENSIEAFKAAVELGIDGIELDVRLTRDGKAVVMHDADLRRIAGDNRRVESLSYRELSDVELRNGTSVPLLDDVTACVPEPVRLDFEVKDPEALEVVSRKLNTSAGLRARSYLSSFHEDVLESAAAALPEVKRLLLMRRWPVRVKRFAEWVASVPISGIGLDAALWNARRVAWVKERALLTVAWEHYGLKSTSRRMRRMRELEVDIMIVNNPRVYLAGR